MPHTNRGSLTYHEINKKEYGLLSKLALCMLVFLFMISPFARVFADSTAIANGSPIESKTDNSLVSNTENQIPSVVNSALPITTPGTDKDGSDTSVVVPTIDTNTDTSDANNANTKVKPNTQISPSGGPNVDPAGNAGTQKQSLPITDLSTGALQLIKRILSSCYRN